MAKKVTASALKPALNAEDKDFLNKLATIDALSQKLAAPASGDEKTLPSLILVRLSMSGLRAAHQDTPTANAEAADLLAQQLGQFVDAAQKYFGDNVLVATVATEQVNRQRRDTKEETKARQGAPEVGRFNLNDQSNR